MSFQKFYARVNRVISAKLGMGRDDFADAPWADLYEGGGDDVTDEEILETLAEADDIAAQMIELMEA